MTGWAMGGVMRVIGAIDVALWDLAGKAAGVPIHRLMGSTGIQYRLWRQFRCFRAH